MIPLKNRESFSLENYHKVAWLEEGIAIADSAIARIDDARSGFLSLLESDDDIVIYGVTSGYGQNAYQRFDKQQRQIHARKISFATSAAFGDPAPERRVSDRLQTTNCVFGLGQNPGKYPPRNRCLKRTTVGISTLSELSKLSQRAKLLGRVPQKIQAGVARR